jgi:hypothetical protein
MSLATIFVDKSQLVR